MNNWMEFHATHRCVVTFKQATSTLWSLEVKRKIIHLHDAMIKRMTREQADRSKRPTLQRWQTSWHLSKTDDHLCLFCFTFVFMYCFYVIFIYMFLSIFLSIVSLKCIIFIKFNLKLDNYGKGTLSRAPSMPRTLPTVCLGKSFKVLKIAYFGSILGN